METVFSRQIQEDVADLKSREKEPFAKGIADRIRFLRLLKEGHAERLADVAALLGYHLRTVQRWWQTYRAGGLAALLPGPPHRGASERITPEAWTGLRAEMEAGHIGSLHDAQVYLRDHWSIDYGIDAISKLFRRRKTKLKTGRPHHRKAASPAVQAAFKK
ncbi:helix-turn-helix domain-containing protein [Azospirillum doebereinerae]|uniref:Uncharacterized protein n=1 Tax=Azospirillum doebereinerae TaxID=92933 RepID=A0A3S0VDG5_9PROT|nr:helix-turn-helix domain-containing protein [Azospirillum doebereinerae]MCG5239930.1 helix-turn-helix domain-containing protein [Azospirillum doebereinerae]RUQ59166.1 hypothetical protein EJ913_31195 [Azospirillum doebereinerae]